MRTHATPLFVAVTLALSMQAQAQQVITDSQHIDLNLGVYRTSADGKDGDVLVATDTGSITATDVTVLAFGGGVFSVYAANGGKIELKRGSVITSANVSDALVTLGKTSSIVADGTVIHTDGLSSAGVDGFGGTITLSNGSITTTGDQSYGIRADGFAMGDTISLSMTNESVTTHGNSRAAAVLAGEHAHLWLTDSTIKTDGMHYGLYIDNRNDADTSAVIAKGLTVQTDTPHAIMVTGGGLLSMAGSTVTSQSGVALYGYDTAIAGTSVNRALITDSTLTTTYGYAIYNRGSRFNLTLDNSTAQGAALLGEDYFMLDTQQGPASIQLTATNNSKLFGNVVIPSGNNATLALATGSLLQGALLQADTARIDLSLDETSTW